MGLDMYLGVKKYIGPSDPKYKWLVKGMGLTRKHLTREDRSEPSLISVTASVCYWRKANAIHGWFVDNVMGGKDECGEYYVSRDKLQQLLNTALTAATAYRAGDTETASRVLPPRAGFFFGSTDVDDYYLFCLETTISQLKRVLTQPEYSDFELLYYHSW